MQEIRPTTRRPDGRAVALARTLAAPFLADLLPQWTERRRHHYLRARIESVWPARDAAAVPVLIEQLDACLMAGGPDVAERITARVLAAWPAARRAVRR